jgi:hypothetical protein
MKLLRAEVTVHSVYPLNFIAYVGDVMELRKICGILSAGQPHAVTYRLSDSENTMNIPKYLIQAE